ncbi:hypothetical protein PIB30_008996 [Stylosanthes scabra]|uniref:Replication protein A 70 kDa DNA-binding subunit B/D first OB fold domain-containing protein n=1 Tax=Stylosanthes scabra TaxID=79078 RepID=A0ABU6S4K5_9FABA|nr:hypothetical protein [Stylosanthes scabra]
MAHHIDFIEDIGTKKGHWRLQVYVIRAWKEMHKTNNNEVNNIELILQDIKGGRIQASIGKSFFSRHGSSIEEFGLYQMNNFIVVDKRLMPRTTEKKWSLNFSNRTIVQRVHQPAFPLEPFRFRDNIQSDVITEVVGKEEPRDITTVTGQPTKRMALKIQDLE